MAYTPENLRAFDIIIVNSSGGKDSQTMLRHVARLAEEQGVSSRVTVVHADLGRVEWGGTKELARKQAEHYGLRFEVVARPQGDLLDHVIDRHNTLRARGDTTTPAWPSSAARWCTSDHKRGQVRKVMTQLVKELNLNRPATVLNCMGLRAEESPARAKKVAFRRDEAASGKGTVRRVWEWLPILDWTEADVWADIWASEVPHHPAYDAGMPRLSCCFCVLSNKSALIRAAQLNPELAAEYRAVEVQVGHRFTMALSMEEIIDQAATTEVVAIENWNA